jgi:hypothetical protein
LCNRSAKCVGLKVVREASAAVDLHDWEPFPVLRLQMFHAADVHFVELEIELDAECVQLFEGALAQMTALRVVDRDVGPTGRCHA